MTSADGNAFLDQDELRSAAVAGDLGIDERLHAGHRRDAGLDPRVSSIRTLPRAADADPTGDAPGVHARGARERDRGAHAVAAFGRLVSRVGVTAFPRAAEARPTGRWQSSRRP